MVRAASCWLVSADARPRSAKDRQDYPYRSCTFVRTFELVRTYVVESYLSRQRAERLGETAGVIRGVAEELTAAGSPVRCERWEFLAEDELCLHFFEAESAEAVAHALERAGLRCERIVETVSSRG
jgi:hypothetical protein